MAVLRPLDGAIALRLVFRTRLAYVLSVVAALLGSFALNLMAQDGSVTGITGAAAATISDGPSLISCSTPFRGCEFTIGAVVALAPPCRLNSRAADVSLFCGLVLIVGSVIGFGPQTVFRSDNAGFPTVGAALVIYIGHRSALATQSLAIKPIVALGLISYSAYSVHLSLIIFYEYYSFRAITPLEGVAFAVVAVELGWAFFKIVEKLFRLNGAASPRTALPPIAFAVVSVGAVDLLGMRNGLEDRISMDAYPPNVDDEESLE